MTRRGLPLPIPRIPPPALTTEELIAAARLRLSAVLGEVRFPTLRWQLVAASDSCGADAEIRAALQKLVDPEYATANSVVHELVVRHHVNLR